MIVVVLIAVAIAAAVSGAAFARSVGRSPPTVIDSDGRSWLTSARPLIEDGRRLSQQISNLIEEGWVEARPRVEPADLSTGLDRLTADLAELATSAPTVMDLRVCRSVAVRSRALSEVLRSQGGCDPTTPSNWRRGVPSEVEERHREFEVALRDLGEHVELL